MKIFVFLVFLSVYFIPNVFIKELVINIASIIWFIFTIFYVIYVYYSKDKEYESNYTSLYCENIPSNKEPEILGVLLTCSVKKEYFIAELMELIRKKSIFIGKSKKRNDYVLIDNFKSSYSLSKSEKFMKKWLLNDIGTDGVVFLNSISKSAKKNSGYFSSCYHEWEDLVNFDSVKYNLFENKKNFIEQVLLYFLSSYLFVIYNIFITKNYIVAFIIFILATSFLIYVNNFYKRTKEANREYSEWMAFKRYIQKPSNVIDEYDNDTLCMYGMYSKVLGTNKEFKRILNKKYKRDKEEIEKNMLLIAIQTGVMDEIDKVLSSAIEKSELLTILYAKNKGSCSLSKSKYNDEIVLITQTDK